MPEVVYLTATLTTRWKVSKIRGMRAFRCLTAVAAMIAPLWAQSSACDLNSDGAVDASDLQVAINMTLALSPCSANVYGANVCNTVVIQRVTNAALGGSCLTGTTPSAHSVTLNWAASSSSGVVG